MPNQEIESLLAKQAIRDVLSRYCRGMDRMDKDMAYSVWHEDGTAHYCDMFEGSGHGFVDWVWNVHEQVQCHSHQITNVLTELDGDTAVSESYVTVALWTRPDEQGNQTEVLGRGRYLDHWSKRGGRWAIDHRTHVLDQQGLRELRRGHVSKEATRDSKDVSSEFFRG